MIDDTDHDYAIRITAGRVVCYRTQEGIEAGVVTSVNEDKEWVEIRDVPGVLPLSHITAVGVNSDEARFDLDGTRPGGTGIYPTESKDGDKNNG